MGSRAADRLRPLPHEDRRGTGDLQPGQSLDIQKTQQEKYENLERQNRQFNRDFLNLQQEERTIYKQAEQETKLQIAAVLEELKKLSVSTKNLAKEVEIASKQVPVEPGVYHVNFFEKLRQTMIDLRKKIDDSASWLSTFNQRSHKKSYYWRQVKKSGTKFMLSQERYMATQAG